MNIENAKRAIAVMKRVQKLPSRQFNMDSWYSVAPGISIRGQTEAEAASCGTAACFLGWLALASDIPEISFGAYNRIEDENGDYMADMALAKFLDISYSHAEGLCGLHGCLPGGDVFPGDATPQDIINSLNYLIVKYEEQE